jgi:two-component system, chemotaxis family, response regulator Rcp1
MAAPLQLLLVEDNPGDADLTRDALAEAKLDVEIHVAVDGTQALDFLLRRPPYANAKSPDLILLDLNLPKMSGREVLAEIKRHEALRVIPVVVLSSSDSETDVAECYRAGANCYVTKPLGLEAFQLSVRAVERFWFDVARLP